MKKIYITLMVLLLSEVFGYSQCAVTVTGSTNVSCNGDCDGTVTIATVGAPNYTYLWSPGGQTIQNPTDLCAGTHTVTMTDANSCVATASVVITEPDVLQDSASITNASCNGDCDGAIDLHPYGGTFPYSYAWSPNGEFTEDLLALCAGSYSVIITDANNCTTQDAMTVSQPIALTVNVTASMGCGTNCDKSATALPSGGTSPYSYVWTPGGQTSQTASGLCAGTHQVSVLDTNGCSATGTTTITNPPDLTVSTSATDASCFSCSDGTVTAVASGGTGAYSYAWSPAGCATATCTGLLPGTYTITITDINNCTADATQMVGSPVGINESDIGDNIRYYPNPFHTNITIEFNFHSNSMIHLSVINVLGEHLYSESIAANTSMKNISLQDFASGIYFLNIEVDGSVSTRKIIKE